MTETLVDGSSAAQETAKPEAPAPTAAAPAVPPLEFGPVEADCDEGETDEITDESAVATADRTGLGAAHLVLLGAVAAVLATLTLTRLQLFAVYENERDAVDLVERLGRNLELRSLDASADAPLGTNLRDAALAAGVSVGNPADAVWLEDGRLLRRRGYLFDLGRDADGRACVRAWPWRAGATGAAAYAWVPGNGLLGHGNGVVHVDAPSPMWTGPKAPPELESLDAAWMELSDSRSLALASRTP